MDGYAVGVKLAFASNAEEMLGLIAGKMMGVHLKAGELKQDFGLIKDAVGGAFAIGGALAMLGVMDKLVHKGAELEDAMYRIQTAGFTPKQLAQVRVNATKVAGQFTNLTETELIKLTGETTAVYGDPGIAMKNLPTVAAYMSAVKFRHPEDAEGAAATAEDAIFKSLRSQEFRGLAQDPAQIKTALAATLKAQEVFGDQFDPNTTFQFLKYARLSDRYMSNRFLYGPGMVVAQEMGGSNAGNSHNMVMNALVGGHMTKQALEEWERLKIINGSHVLMAKKGQGGGFRLQPGAVPELGLLQSNFDQWAQKYIATGVESVAHGDPAKRDLELRTLFGRGTQQQYAELMAFQTGPGGRLQKDVGRMALAMTPDQAVTAAMGNLATSAQSAAVQLDRIKTNLGAPAAAAVGKVLPHVVGLEKRVADSLGGHRGMAGGIDLGIIGGAAGGIGWGVSKLWPVAKMIGGQVAKLMKAGGGAGAAGAEGAEAATVVRSVGAFARVAPVLEAVGAGVGAITAAVAAAPIELIAGATAVVAALFVGIYESAKHWDASKNAVANFKAEWAGLVDVVASGAKKLEGVAGLGGPKVPALHVVAQPPAFHVHATIPVHLGGKHVDTMVKHTMARVAERGLFNATSNSDPRITPGHSGSVPMGSF